VPKQNYEINTFNRGIIANPQDELDIPDEAATYSLNVDPLTDGSIGGIPDDSFLKESGFTTNMSVISFFAGTVSGPTQSAPGPDDQYIPEEGD
jgi:hypothetical protein|tara:strand:+ start:1472 stop:1750 length:279 start_codon:yes stop_codon:yes gene_type:complete